MQFPDTVGVGFTWKVKQIQEVQKGDCIAETYAYSRFMTKQDKKQKLKAPSSGVIVQFRDNCINYGVISIRTDNKDAIKAWVKAGGK